MTTPDEPEQEQPPTPLVPAYVITNGRGLPDDDTFSLITLVTTAQDSPVVQHLDPEKRRLLELCSGGHLSVAEIAGHTQFPVGVVKILLSDLTQGGYLVTRAPIPTAKLVDRNILEQVLHGLQARFG